MKEDESSLFANIGEYEPCGIFTKGHFILIILTIIGIIIALKYTIKKNKQEVYNIIKNLTITMWIFEILKIIYSINQNSLYKVNTYLPLYYCSLALYAGLLSSFAKGKLKRVGDVVLATCSIIGGIVFIIYPSTSLLTYPAFHILSIHSFVYHGVMIYLGILINVTKYIELKKEDIIYYSGLVGIICFIALIINHIFDSNLMFISQNFPVTPIKQIYNLTNGSFLFNLIMMSGQMTIPFYISYYVIQLIQYLKNYIEDKNIGIVFENSKELLKEENVVRKNLERFK